MQCKNHPGVAGVARCAGCAETFCGDCLIEIQGQHYCGSCKVMTVQAQPAPAAFGDIPCKEAKDALWYAIIGIFCFGIILEPIAIVKALKAKKLIADNPRLSGAGNATAALVIAIIVLCLTVIGVLARISAAGSGY